MIPKGRLPAPWRGRDVGGLQAPGKVIWEDGTFTFQITPRSEDADFDSFHTVFLSAGGESEITARVVSMTRSTDDVRAGVIMASQPSMEAGKILLAVTSDSEAHLRTWAGKGGSTRSIKDGWIELPYWVKLRREGNDVKASISPDGRNWQLLRKTKAGFDSDKYIVGLAAKVDRWGGMSEVVIDSVRLNGEPIAPREPLPPCIVLRSGSILAADVIEASPTLVVLGGRWEGRTVATPWVARVEYAHPLPTALADTAAAGKPGVILRGGEFAAGALEEIAEGRLSFRSPILGKMEKSTHGEIEVLILRNVSPPPIPVGYEVETHDGSLLLAKELVFTDGGIELSVPAFGGVSLGAEEVRELRRRAASAAVPRADSDGS